MRVLESGQTIRIATGTLVIALLSVGILFRQSIGPFRYIPPRQRTLTLRIDEIPLVVDWGKLQSDLEKIIQKASGIVSDITIRSFVPRNQASASATVVVRSALDAEVLPGQLRAFAASCRQPYTFTSQFEDITPLYSSGPDAEVDVIAVTGLGGHSLGSWKSKLGDDVWLRDFLPSDIPNIRVLLYGYDSTLQGSTSKQSIADIGFAFLEQIIAFRERDETAQRPIVFIGHSLGGLVIKQALVRAHKSGWKSAEYHRLSQASFGLLFFGVPNSGLRHEELSILVKGQPNEMLVHELLADKDGEPQLYLRTLREQFGECGQGRYEVVAFYERQLTSTVQIDEYGKAGRTGPKCLQVLIDSACQTGLEGQPPGIPLDTNHSGLVKFDSPSSGAYPIVCERLRQLVVKAPAAVSTRFDHVPPQPLKKAEQDCLLSLSFPGMSQRKAGIERSTENTCTWLFEHNNWKQWEQKPGGVLWIQGSPGSGKSTIMEYATRQFINLYGSRTIVISFYCYSQGRTQLEKSPLGLYRSILHQLLNSFPKAFTGLTNHFALQQATMGQGWEWQEQELRDYILSGLKVILQKAPVTLFLDALDEMGNIAAVQVAEHIGQLILDLAQQKTPFHLRVCISCRYYPVVKIEGGLEIHMEQENRNDIAAFVETKLSRQFPEDIRDLVTAKARGIFLWARLVIEPILRLRRNGDSELRIRAEIEALPPELDDLYHSMIYDRDPLDRSERRQLLSLVQCLCFSTRPLYETELPWAMAMMGNPSAATFEEHEQSMEYISQERVEAKILSLSRGLVKLSRRLDGSSWGVDELYRLFFETMSQNELNLEEGVVRFIHQSVKDYFVNKGLRTLDGLEAENAAMTKSVPQSLPSTEQTEQTAHLKLALACMCYLRLSADYFNLDQHTPPEIPIFDKLRVVQPFLKYAAGCWVYHIRMVKPNGTHIQIILQALGCSSQSTIDYWCKWSSSAESNRYWLPTRSVVPPISLGSNLIHVFAVYGLDLLQCLLRSHEKEESLRQLNEKNDHGRTPLAEAASWNSHKGVRILLEYCLEIGGVDVDSRDFLGKTPLSLAVALGNKAVPIVQALLETGEVDINSQDNQGRTPLWWAVASYSPRDEVIKILSSSSLIEPNLSDDNGHSPLCVAAVRRNHADFKLLVQDAKANVNEVDDKGRPLLWLTLAHHNRVEVGVDIASMFLDAGADANIWDAESNMTMLGWTSRLGYETLAQALIAKYPDRFGLDAREIENQSLSPAAVEEDHRHRPGLHDFVHLVIEDDWRVFMGMRQRYLSFSSLLVDLADLHLSDMKRQLDYYNFQLDRQAFHLSSQEYSQQRQEIAIQFKDLESNKTPQYISGKSIVSKG